MDSALRQYFDATPCYLTVQNRDLRIIDANQRFRDDFGDPEGRYCYQVYKHRSEKCEVCPVEKTFQDGQSHSSQEQVRSLQGRDVDVIVNTSPIRNGEGEVTAVLEMSTDVTEMKRLQNQFKKSQGRYRRLFEEVPCYITIQNREFEIVEANRLFREDFGHSLGRHCYRAYKKREEPCIPCPVHETFADGEVHRSEEVVKNKNGETVNTLVYSTPIYNAKGEIDRVMEMSTNITPIRNLQSQLESTGLLISSISHGIKGLLSGLDGGIYLVNTGMKKDNPKRLAQGWEMVQRNVERIRSMVLNILYYAKERDPDHQSLPASGLAREIAQLLGPKAEEAGVNFRTAIDAEAGELEADEAAVRALLINLLENSLDACRVDKKKSDHWVGFSMRGNEKFVVFEVADNGIGMDEETRDRAFSLFFSSKGAKGTGLGLFIAAKIARAHGGRIDVKSELNEGATFTITLPRHPADGLCGEDAA